MWWILIIWLIIKLPCLQICLLAKIYFWPQNQYSRSVRTHLWVCWLVKSLSCSISLFPVEIIQGNGLPSSFNSHTKKYPFHNVFNAMLFSFLCSLLVICLFKMTPKCTTEVLSSTPNCKAVMCLAKKIHFRWASFWHELQCCWLWVQCYWINIY